MVGKLDVVRKSSPMRAVALLLAVSLVLSGCAIPGRLGKLAYKAAVNVAKPKPKKPKQNAKQAPTAAPATGLKGLMDGGQANAYAQGGGMIGGGGGATADGIFEFSNVVQTHAQGFGRVGWHSSLTTAAQQARTEGKPLLILFTHQMSASAQALENTLILTPEFRSLVEEKFVPLRINFGDTETRQSPYYRDFKARLEARGYPTIVVTLPDGAEVTKISGYNEKEGGESSSYRAAYLKKLQDSVTKGESLAEERRKKLESQGYRMWTAREGKPVFARLEALDANMATFTTEWGESFKTFLNRLSEEDKAQIELRRDKVKVGEPS